MSLRSSRFDAICRKICSSVHCVSEHSSTPQRLVCKREKCGTSFCAACRQPYHFRTSCEEALRINARWVAFLERGLKDFLVAAVKVDPDRYHPVLKELTRSKGAADAPNQNTTFFFGFPSL